MPTRYPAPSESAVQSLIEGLVPTPVSVTRTRVGDPERDATGMFAEYIAADDGLAVVGYADPTVVNYVGGSMMGVEADAIADATSKAMTLDDGIEGFKEVANVFASCLNTDFTPHLRLGTVHKLPAPLTEEVKQLWRQPRGRRAYKVSLDDDVSGNLILYLG